MTLRRLSVLALALAAVTLAGCGTLETDDLASVLQRVGSFAAEGELLAEQAYRHADPTEFTWLHAQELRHRVVELESATEGEVVTRRAQDPQEAAHRIEVRTARALSVLHEEPNDPRAAAAVQTVLRRQSEAAQKLAEELG